MMNTSGVFFRCWFHRTLYSCTLVPLCMKIDKVGNHWEKGGSNMEIIQDDAKKLVQVWLSRKESGDEALQNQLKPMYAQWKQQKYMVAVFHSGQEDLKENTMALLAYNKRRSAELAVQREKKRRTASLER